MIVNYNYIKDEENNVLIYTYTDEKGVTTEKRIPIFDENGNFTKEFEKEVQKKKAKRFFPELDKEEKNEVESSEIVEKINEDEVEIVNNSEVIEPESNEDEIPCTALAVVGFEEVDEELKNKKKFTWKKAAKWLLILALGGTAVYGISQLAGCNEGKTVVEDATPSPKPEEEEQTVATPTPVIIPTVEEQLEDSRYTEITNEKFEETVFNLQKEFVDHGIELNGEDVVRFVTLANLTHIQETNPELLNTILGEGVDVQQFITKAAQIIGQTVYLEVTDRNEQIDWTIALIDDKDKKVADDLMNNVVYAAKEYAEGEPIIEGGTYATRDEKRIYIETLVAKEYITKDYDNTTDVQEIGADFVTDAIITGILLNDISIKQYISTEEVINDLKVISSNKDVVSNLHALIKNGVCKEEKTLTLK